MVPGKRVLGSINRALQNKHGFALTVNMICSEMIETDLPGEFKDILQKLNQFCASE